MRGAVYWISGILFVPLASLLALRLFNPSVHDVSLSGTLELLTVWAVGTVLALLRVRIARLEILPDGFRYVSLLRDMRLRYEDVAGYRAQVGRYGGRSGEAIGILYDTTGRQRLRISAYLEHPKRVREWMHAHFRDLDATDTAEETEMLARLSESSPGTLPFLRIAARILDIASIALGLLIVGWGAVGDLGPAFTVIAVLIFATPVTALWLRARFGRIVSFERTVYRSPIPAMDSALIVPLLAGWLVAFVVPPVHYRGAWPLALAVSLIFYFGARSVDRRFFNNRLMEIFMLAISLGYGYGLVCFSNAALDRGDVERQAVTVRSRSVRRGFATVAVSPPSSPGETHSLKVSRSLEELLPPGSSAVLLVKPGALGIRWIAGVAPSP